MELLYENFAEFDLDIWFFDPKINRVPTWVMCEVSLVYVKR